jgi:ATP-dependent helicase HrpB
LTEARVAPGDAAAAEALLVREVVADPERALPLDDPDVSQALARIRCLRAWMPELGLPEPRLEDLAAAVCAGRLSFEETRKAPLLDLLRATLTHVQRRALDTEAPERLVVPSGSAVRLTYEAVKPPVLAVRIQELFGLRETPRVASGRVAVLLHLLAPNGRPQQVTTDLTSFWNTTYASIRKELRARYPRHAWPEDPWTAPAERRPKRRPTRS